MPAAVNPDIAGTGLPVHGGGRCSIYNTTSNEQAIIDFVKALRDLSGNLRDSYNARQGLSAVSTVCCSI